MMTQRTQNKSPLVMAWIGQDDPLRGDSQMAVGLAKLCAEMTGGVMYMWIRRCLKHTFLWQNITVNVKYWL